MSNLTNLSSQELADTRHKARVALQSVCLLNFDSRFKAESAIFAAQRIMRELDDSERPLRDELETINEEISRRERVTLEPWRVSTGRKYKDGIRCFAGSPSENTWNRVAWLRIVYREERFPRWQWEVDLSYLRRDLSQVETNHSDADENDGFSGNHVLGPETADPDADFARHRATVDAMLAKAGYILLT